MGFCLQNVQINYIKLLTAPLIAYSLSNITCLFRLRLTGKIARDVCMQIYSQVSLHLCVGVSDEVDTSCLSDISDSKHLPTSS